MRKPNPNAEVEAALQRLEKLLIEYHQAKSQNVNSRPNDLPPKNTARAS
jgi:hypothetical protein